MSTTLTSLFAPFFTVVSPRQQLYSAVFNSPHSGRTYPHALQAMSRLDARALRRSEDFLVDELFAGAAALGCPLLKAEFPRVFLDVNREPYELDPAMFCDPLPRFVNTTSLRVAGGLGTIPRIVSEHEEIYRDALSWHDASERIDRAYLPYHRELSRLLDSTQTKFGQVLLIDCHSMPSSAARLSIGAGGSRADIVIGDRYGSACDTDISKLLEDLFAKLGLRVVHNKPYAGGHITQCYGRPGEQINALQVEINRGLYMNERKIEPTGDFEALQDAITTVMEIFLPALDDLLAPPAAAAE